MLWIILILLLTLQNIIHKTLIRRLLVEENNMKNEQMHAIPRFPTVVYFSLEGWLVYNNLKEPINDHGLALKAV